MPFCFIKLGVVVIEMQIEDSGPSRLFDSSHIYRLFGSVVYENVRFWLGEEGRWAKEARSPLFICFKTSAWLEIVVIDESVSSGLGRGCSKLNRIENSTAATFSVPVASE